MTSETDVLIVGAGPTGLALAISLQQAGISHLIIDKLPEGLNTSRAAVIHVHTLEVLDKLGVARQLADSGLRLKEFRVRDRDRSLLRIPFDGLPSPYPYLLMLPQEQTERILSQRLAALGGGVHRGVTATGVQQDASGATVTLNGHFGERPLRARYVVGGDGMHSVVRAAAGAEFEGGTYEDSFLLADVRMDWPLGTGEVSLFFSPAGMAVVAPLPGNRFRVVATVDRAPERPEAEHIQALLDERGPARGRTVVKEVLWSSRFRIHHRLAKSYRCGRLFLMGDAAHVHSPAGGQGMNTGLVDAIVLGQLLEQAIRAGDDSVLDQYQDLRRPAAEEVLELAGRLTSMATVRGRIRRMGRNAALRIINVFPPARKKLIMNLSGLSRKALAEVAKADPAGQTYGMRLQIAKGEKV
jgi:2-polyprenyl-6-methoxyphenol hydroxylase-like FAD-dependent oxidoreductase